MRLLWVCLLCKKTMSTGAGYGHKKDIVQREKILLMIKSWTVAFLCHSLFLYIGMLSAPLLGKEPFMV